MEIRNFVWQEKYRPKHVKDIISPHTPTILKAMENPLAIQNFIFYSKVGGTGKTSMSKAIVNDLQCDVLNLNASDERSIDTIRSKVKEFMITQSTNINVKKCIIMDEGEKLTKDAADALKNMMEEYSSNAFIILTTNNLNKIPEPLQTRFKILTFTKPHKHDIYTYLENICKNEGLKYNEDGINQIIKLHYPSIRKMVNHLQDLFNRELDVIKENIVSINDEYDKVWQLIKDQKYNDIKKQILEEGIDVEELNDFIFQKVMNGDLELRKEITFVPILARNEKDFRLGADKNIIFMASIIQMIKAMRS